MNEVNEVNAVNSVNEVNTVKIFDKNVMEYFVKSKGGGPVTYMVARLDL